MLPPLSGQEGLVDTSDFANSGSKDSINFNLLVAASKGNNSEVERLLRTGADIQTTSGEGATPLVYAIANGHLSTVRILIANDPAINRKTRNFETPLIIAAVLSGYEDVADLLVQNGPKLEAREKGGFTPFLIAAQNSDTFLMDLLLKKGVNLYEKTINNYNALGLAIIQKGKKQLNSFLKKVTNGHQLIMQV